MLPFPPRKAGRPYPGWEEYCAKHDGYPHMVLGSSSGNAIPNWCADSVPVCGLANTHSYSSAPHTASYLCQSGNPTTVIGAGPWFWNCTGAKGNTVPLVPIFVHREVS